MSKLVSLLEFGDVSLGAVTDHLSDHSPLPPLTDSSKHSNMLQILKAKRLWQVK